MRIIYRFNGTPILWRSKQQKTMSTAEAQYYLASERAVQGLYSCRLIINMDFDLEGWTPVYSYYSYEDSNTCNNGPRGINVMRGPGRRERADLKHIDIRKHFTHEVQTRMDTSVLSECHSGYSQPSCGCVHQNYGPKSLQAAQFVACTACLTASSVDLDRVSVRQIESSQPLLFTGTSLRGVSCTK